MGANSTDHRNETTEYESDENRIITYGSFFCENAAARVFGIIALAVLIVGELALLYSFVCSFAYAGSGILFNFFELDIVVIVWAVVWITILRVVTKGKEYRFALSKSTVVINSKKEKERVIYLSDIVEMEHRPMCFLRKQYGWKITFITRYQKISYRVLFPNGRKSFAYEKMSLAVVEDYCPKKEKQ